MKRLLLSLIPVLLVPALFVGCGPKLNPYVNRNLAGGENIQMAILPFDNLSKEQRAAKTLETMALVEFLKQTSIKVIDPGVVHEALVQERVRLATAIPREALVSLGQRLGVDLFVVGIIHEFAMGKSSGAGGLGDIPIISLTLRIMDAKTGEILWAVSVNKRGNDRETVFGIGRVSSLDRLADETAREIALNFSKSLRGR